MKHIAKSLKEMDWFKIVVFFVMPLIAILGILYVPMEKQEIPFNAEIFVADQEGYMDLKNDETQKTSLNFGGVSAGYKVEKNLNLNMDANAKPADVSFKVEGTIKDFIEISRPNFVMTEPTKISVAANVPKGTPAGTYTGKVTVVYTKTTFRKLMNMLG